MRPKLVCGIVCLMLCLLGVGSPVFGQSDVASVTGRVLDPNGAIIIEASVTARNMDTGVATVVQTNPEGIYSFVNLSPGNYEFTVSKRGFKEIVKPGVTLHLADTVSLNFNMVVGELTEKVTVEAGASMINTTDASISTVVDQSYIKNMPLNGRSLQDLIELTPGVTPALPTTGFSGRGISGELSVNGQRTESNNYTVDGVSANVGASTGAAAFSGAGVAGAVPSETNLGTTQALVSVDELQEFRVQTSTYSAEYGRSPGAQIAFSTKSGTNQWHGTAYDYVRNNYFDANNWFNDFLGAPEPALRQNDFGGTLGGPVRIPHAYNGKDKTFFFVSYEGLRLTTPQPAGLTPVPDYCLRGLATPGSPGVCENPDGSPYVDSKGVNRTPAAAALQPVVNAWPVQNGPELLITVKCNPATDPACSANGTKLAQSGFASFIGTWSNPGAIDSSSVRFDHVVSNKLRLFFRFNNTTSNVDRRNGATNSLFPASINSTSDGTVRTYTAGASSIFSSRWGNEFRVNYTSNEEAANLINDGFGGATPVDLPKLAGLDPVAGPVVTLSVSPFNTALSVGPESGAQRQWNFVDTASYSVGRHQFKFGVDYRRLTPFAVQTTPFVSYRYSGGSFMSRIETNNPNNIIISVNGPAYPLYQNFSAFAADEWKATSRLNLSFGLRWEVNPPPGVTQGPLPYTLQGSSPANFALAPYGTPLWKTTWYNFAPRLGAAYIVRNNPGRETVVRVGGGLFFDAGQQLGSESFQGPGFTALSFTAGPFGSSLTIPPLPPPATNQADFDTLLANSRDAWGFAPHLQLPYTLQWNATVEQALGSSQALTMSYVGSHAARLLQQNNYFTPFNTSPSGDTFTFIENGLTADYHSAQAQFRRRLSRGLTALASYTWSHCIDYGSTNFDVGFQRGNCDYDVRHNFSTAFSYDVPGVGHGRLLGALLHNWGVDDRFMVRTAFPVNLRGDVFQQPNGKNVNSGVNYNPALPLYVTQCVNPLATGPAMIPCPGGKGFNPDPNQFTSVPLDPTTFEPVGPGNLPRNFLRGFGAWQMDTAIRREFPVYESLKLQFRAEAFNIFNHPNFGTVNTGIGDPRFGEATATLSNSLGILNSLYQQGGPRSLQFALKLVF